MASGCVTPLPVQNALGGYDNGEHAGGTDTPPAFTHANAAFLVQDLQGRLNRLKLEQGLQEPKSSLPVDNYRKIEPFEHELPQSMPSSFIQDRDVPDPPMPCFLSKDRDLPDQPVRITPGVVLPPPPQLPPGILLPFQQPQSVMRPSNPPTPAQKTVDQLTSLGSIGHPATCAPACKYVKRKGGCREGASCPQCHMCFWSRHPDPASSQKLATKSAELSSETSTAESAGVLPMESLIMSEGTRGHPDSCAPACRYLRRKQGCRDGAACTRCHACIWHRRTAETSLPDSSPALQADLQVDALQRFGGMAMPPDDLPVDMCPSIGSWGHPVHCAFACPDGPGECKAGKQCLHCHLCRWSSYDLALGRKTFSL